MVVRHKFSMVSEQAIDAVISDIKSMSFVFDYDTRISQSKSLMHFFESAVIIFRDEVYHSSQGVRPLGKFLDMIVMMRNTTLCKINAPTCSQSQTARKHFKFISKTMNQLMSVAYDGMGISSKLLAMAETAEGSQGDSYDMAVCSVMEQLCDLVFVLYSAMDAVKSAYDEDHFKFSTFVRMIGVSHTGSDSSLGKAASTAKLLTSFMSKSLTDLEISEMGFPLSVNLSNHDLGIVTKSKYANFKHRFENSNVPSTWDINIAFTQFKKATQSITDIALMDITSPMCSM